MHRNNSNSAVVSNSKPPRPATASLPAYATRPEHTNSNINITEITLHRNLHANKVIGPKSPNKVCFVHFIFQFKICSY